MPDLNTYPDVEADTLPPVWPVDPASLVVDDPAYEPVAVPLSSIAMVTDRVLKVSSIYLPAIYIPITHGTHHHIGRY